MLLELSQKRTAQRKLKITVTYVNSDKKKHLHPWKPKNAANLARTLKRHREAAIVFTTADEAGRNSLE